MKSKWIIIALSLLLIISLFSHARDIHSEEQREKAFLRTAYFYITRIVSSVDRLDEYHSTGVYDDLNSEKWENYYKTFPEASSEL